MTMVTVDRLVGAVGTVLINAAAAARCQGTVGPRGAGWWGVGGRRVDRPRVGTVLRGSNTVADHKLTAKR